jgi:hypothetical protein
MNPSNPWLRFFAGMLGAAIAIRLTVELLRPIFPFLVGALTVAAALIVWRWWRNSRW